MATEIPPSMKVVAPFVVKAKQMEKADPVISYFCHVYTVQQALSRGLTKSAEGMAFTGQVMDTLEQRKAELADHEAVADDLVGKIYVDQFANKVFSNAENAQNARRCTKQTAETFMAASVFLELLRVFGELDPEIAQKITFAKYSAARILKALKAGEDPNPPIEEQQPEDEIPPVFTDMEIPKLQEVSPVSPVSPHPQPATVEDAVDESESLERSMARMSTGDVSLHPSRMVTPNNAPPPPPSFPSPPETEAPYHPNAHLPSRTETMSTAETFSAPSQPPSTGYFPLVPQKSQETSVAPPTLELPYTPAALPSAPSTFPSAAFSPTAAPPTLPSAPSLLPPKSPPTVPENFYAGSAASAGASVGVGVPGSSAPNPHWLGHVSPPPPNAPPISHQLATGQTYFYSPPPGTNPHPIPQQPYAHPQGSPFQRAPAQPSQPPPYQRKLADPDEDPGAIKEAHKCIRWADSALNFDDVPTAVKQLRLALQALGAE
ncbi:hypothetical protein ABW20_dc0110692 [Dactylellina cionopaga]|nr:hypothetical protein ABW20_dc0110692 [Dactylellina cionopaga]